MIKPLLAEDISSLQWLFKANELRVTNNLTFFIHYIKFLFYIKHIFKLSFKIRNIWRSKQSNLSYIYEAWMPEEIMERISIVRHSTKIRFFGLNTEL